MGPLWFCLLALLEIHRHPMQKEFLKSCERFLRAALTVHGHAALSEKLPKWHFLKFFGPNDFIWGAIKVPFFDFIQKMSQALSSSVQLVIWEDKLDYLNNPSQDFKNSFCLWFLWILAMLEGKTGEGPFFKGLIW